MGQVARGGRDDADVDLHYALPADAAEALVGQHAQDAALRRDRHVGDLVEEQCAAMRLFEQAGTNELPPLLHPEQFLLDAFGRHARGVDDDERRSGALAPAVKQPCGDFLADPGRAHDQHAAAGRRDTFQGGAHAVDRAGIAGEIGIAADDGA